MPSFKESKTFDERLAESTRIKSKYSNNLPVIVEKAPKSDLANVDKTKYLVPYDLTVAQFTHVIRRRLTLGAEKAIFFFCNKNMIQTSAAMSQIYSQYVDSDGFLYIQYSGENTFGSETTEEETVEVAEEEQQ